MFIGEELTFDQRKHNRRDIWKLETEQNPPGNNKEKRLNYIFDFEREIQKLSDFLFIWEQLDTPVDQKVVHDARIGHHPRIIPEQPDKHSQKIIENGYHEIPDIKINEGSDSAELLLSLAEISQEKGVGDYPHAHRSGGVRI